ncbi:hypothetical protein G6F35_013083 [Rhizopus arrhizus]|nr:hypothetical protein G6F35_013083 [Rhizopus arrhizus]
MYAAHAGGQAHAGPRAGQRAPTEAGAHHRRGGPWRRPRQTGVRRPGRSALRAAAAAARHRPRRAAGGAAAAGRRWQGRRDPGAVWRCAAGAAGHAAAPAGRARFGRSGTDRGAGGLHRLRPHRA